MSREAILILLGAIVFFTPFLGVPNDWKKYILAGVGFLVAVVGYQLRRAAYLRSIEKGNGERHADMFVESAAPDFRGGDKKKVP